MSTDISMQTTSYQVGNRQWLLAEPDVKTNVTLDISKFTAGTHYPNGFIPSGIVLAVNPAGHLAPYLNSAVDSTNVAVGILRASLQVIRPDGSTKGLIGAAVMKAFGVVSVSKLPIANTVTTGGFIDATGQTDLALIHFAA